MEFNEFEKLFEEKEKENNVKISEEKIEKFYKYMKSLIEWNEKINLTAITDEKEIIEKHFIDSLTILKYIEDGYNMIDVGTGAGFPGLPVAISCKAKVTLLDSLNKRIKFLDEVIRTLGLEKIRTIHGRAEDFAKKKEYRECFDLCVSRAVANLATLSEYCLPFVKVEGEFISYKSGDSDEEIRDAEFAVKVLGGKITDVDKFQLPGTDMGRSLVKIKKVKNTAGKYPRKAGLPSKEPLKK